MTGKTHMMGGAAAAAGLSIAVGANIPTFAILFCGGIAGALLPDIDHPNSMASKRLFIVSILYKILSTIENGLARMMGAKSITGHRGITHSIAIPAIVFTLCYYFLRNQLLFLLVAGILTGWVSHIILDMLNPSGVPILLPVSWKRFRLLPKKMAIPTKNFADGQQWKENTFFVLITIITVLLVKGFFK